MDEISANKHDPQEVIPKILMPLPDQGFCPTEACIPWRECHSRGWQVTISTEHGIQPQADQHKLHGPLPGLVSAGAEAKAAHQLMIQDPSYQHPIPYAEIDPQQYHAILLPGGDALPMAQYLESSILQAKVLQFWQLKKLVGAICHGLLVLARSEDPQTGHSVLYGRKVTAPAAALDRFVYYLDRWFVKHGYIMYPKCVAEEVRDCLQSPHDLSGASSIKPYVVVDGNLVTSRWYMDAELFAKRFADILQERISTGI
jgi:putative intracellular protease/amidase